MHILIIFEKGQQIGQTKRCQALMLSIYESYLDVQKYQHLRIKNNIA